MITSTLAALSLACGQAPVAPIAPTVPVPIAEAPAEATPATKYLVEKMLEGTRAGQILECNGIKFYGWVQMGYSAGSTRSSTLPGAPFADRSGEFTLNQAYFRIEKPIDTEKKEFQLGFRNDYIAPGTDARFTIMRDLFDKQRFDGRVTPIDNVTSYMEAFMPNLLGGTSVKVGRIATHCEYETMDGTTTPFLSRSYTFQYNPFSHMAVLFTSPLGDNLTASYGVSLGNDNFVGPTNRLNFIGSLKWAPKDGDTTIAFNTVVTNPKYQPGEAFDHYNVYNVVLTHKLGCNLTYALDSTYSHENEVPLAGGIGSTHWYGFAQYLAYDHSKCLQSNLRVELFKDEDGYRTGTAGLYTSLTYGMTWKPNESVWIRPEARYDYNVNGPFENGERNLVVGALSVILRF